MEEADEFWQFSLNIYDKPGVSDNLIDLQERYGIDINVILFCCWCGMTGRVPINDSILRSAIELTNPWRETVVERLRLLRKDMKEGVPGVPLNVSNPIRHEIKLLELSAERVQQVLLAKLAPNPLELESTVKVKEILGVLMTTLRLNREENIYRKMDAIVLACAD